MRVTRAADPPRGLPPPRSLDSSKRAAQADPEDGGMKGTGFEPMSLSSICVCDLGGKALSERSTQTDPVIGGNKILRGAGADGWRVQPL